MNIIMEYFAMGKSGKYLTFSAAFFAAFILFTIIVSLVGKAPIGQNGAEVGLASLNSLLTPKYNGFFYGVSEFLGYFCILICVIFGFVGLIQLIKRRNLFKVDGLILLMGVYYIVVILFYVLFDFVAVNVRPYGEIESSYPSSHTVLSVCVLISAIKYFELRIYNEGLNKKVKIIGNVLVLVTVISRFFSGMHWFTDIIGAILLSSALACLFVHFANKHKRKRRINHEC